MLSRENIELWCKYGVSCGEKYMAIMTDGESEAYFPVFAKDEAGLASKKRKHEKSGLQCIVGKFDLEGVPEDDIDCFFKAVKTVDATAAVSRLLKEIDKLHALSMQVLEEIEKLRDKESAIELWGGSLSRSEAAIKAQREVTKWQRELLDKMVAGERE